MITWPKLTIVAAAVLGLLLPAGDAAAAPANSWPMAGYNAARSNLNPLETALTGASLPAVQLQRSITLAATSAECAVVETAPVVNGNTLYATSGTDLVAYNLTTGGQLWRSTIDSEHITIYRSLLVSGGRVYVGGSDCVSQSDPRGEFWVFNATTGAPIALPDDPLSHRVIDSLVVSGSRMILSGRNINDGTAYFAVYDTATFTMQWGNDTCAPNPVLVVGAALMATCPTEGTPKSLRAYSLVDGHLVWSKPGNWRPRRGDTDAASATALYASNPAGYLTSLVPSTGAIIWTSATQRGHVLAVGKKRVYVNCTGPALCALNRANGRLLWKKPTGGFAVTSAVVASDVVYPAPSMWPRLAGSGANIVLGIPYPARDAGDQVIVASGRLIVTNLGARTIEIYGL